MPQATSPLPFPAPNEKGATPSDAARILTLCQDLQAAKAKAEEASNVQATADEAWFALRDQLGSQPGEDTNERRQQLRAEKAHEEALDECVRLLREIARHPVTSGEALDLKIGVLRALLAEEKADLSTFETTDTTDMVAYAIVRDVALLRGAL